MARLCPIAVVVVWLAAASGAAAQEQRGQAAGAHAAKKAAPRVAARIGMEAPDFALKATDGKTYKLSGLKDKIVVLEWWNRDCPVSRRYVPTMKKLAEKYKDKGVVWLGVDSTHYQTDQKRQAFIRKQAISYPILIDRDGTVGRAYGARTTPHMFIIEKGKLVYAGAIDDRGKRNYVAEALDALLAGRKVPLAKTKPFGCSVKYRK